MTFTNGSAVRNTLGHLGTVTAVEQRQAGTYALVIFTTGVTGWWHAANLTQAK